MVAPSDTPPEDRGRQDFYARIKRAKMDQTPLAVLVQEMRTPGVAALAPLDAAEVPAHRPAQPQMASEKQAIGAHGITGRP